MFEHFAGRYLLGSQVLHEGLKRQLYEITSDYDTKISPGVIKTVIESRGELTCGLSSWYGGPKPLNGSRHR